MINCLQIYEIYQQIWENCLQISQLAGIPDSSIPGFLQDWGEQYTIRHQHLFIREYEYEGVAGGVGEGEVQHSVRLQADKGGQGDEVPRPHIHFWNNTIRILQTPVYMQYNV